MTSGRTSLRSPRALQPGLVAIKTASSRKRIRLIRNKPGDRRFSLRSSRARRNRCGKAWGFIGKGFREQLLFELLAKNDPASKHRIDCQQRAQGVSRGKVFFV